MDDPLLHHYEKELGLLRHSLRTFASRHPKIGARLAISGDHSDDDHVETLLQSAAMVAAHLDVKIENEYPEFTEPLLEVLYPQYLRPIPACSIAFFEADVVLDTLTQPAVIEKGTQLLAQTGECRFRTVYGVTLSPLRITKVHYAATVLAPADISLPADTTGILSITFALASESTSLSDSAPDALRIHLHGQEEVVAALLDTLFLDVTSALVEADNKGKWKPLSQSPVSAVGLDQDSLIVADGTPMAFSLLTEYLTFPDKFNFIDVDFAAIRRKTGSAKQVTLHLSVSNAREASTSARLSKVSEKNFKLHCTPVVNLFKQRAVPIKVDGRTTPYTVLPKSKHGSTIEIYAIDEVRAAGGILDSTVIPPHHALTHGGSSHLHTPHWIMGRSDAGIDQGVNYEAELGLVGVSGSPTSSDIDQLTLELTCTNRDLPSAMAVGTAGGELTNETGPFPCKISLLSRPTRRVRLSHRNGALWRLLKFLTPHPLQLNESGLTELKRLFRQYATGSSAHLRYLDGVTALTQRASLRWILLKPSPQFVRGIEVELTVDEQAFVANSISTFGAVMDQFFARYAPANSFVQLVVVSQDTRREIQRYPSRQGATSLI